MSSASVARAKKFLIDRTLAQAERDNVPMSPVEAKMLGFAEDSASASDMETGEEFERDYNDEEYEAKIAELLRRAYKRDEEGGEEAAWDEALTDLAEEDAYLLVMLRRAGIAASSPFSFLLDWRFVLGLLPACIAVAAGIVLAFTPFGARLVPNESLRLMLLLLLLAAPFLIGRLGRKPTF